MDEVFSRLLRSALMSLLALTGTFALAAPPPTDETLFIAIDDDSTARVLSLLAAGANPNARDDRGEPASIYALHTAKPAVAEVLVKAKGIDLEAENKYGQTVMMVAAYQGRLAMVQELIDADAEVNHKGWTALHFAASSGQVDVVKLLLDNSAYIDAESPSRTTPLMMAARVKDRPTCVLLIQEGADPTPINAVGLAASDFARRAGDAELADWLAQSATNWHTAHPPPPPLPVAPAGPPLPPAAEPGLPPVDPSAAPRP
jgi:ankyrin repeat protein